MVGAERWLGTLHGTLPRAYALPFGSAERGGRKVVYRRGGPYWAAAQRVVVAGLVPAIHVFARSWL